jgi:hypothetical protein
MVLLTLLQVESELASAVLLDQLQHVHPVSGCHLSSWGCSSHLQLAQVHVAQAARLLHEVGRCAAAAGAQAKGRLWLSRNMLSRLATS